MGHPSKFKAKPKPRRSHQETNIAQKIYQYLQFPESHQFNIFDNNVSFIVY